MRKAAVLAAACFVCLGCGGCSGDGDDPTAPLAPGRQPSSGGRPASKPITPHRPVEPASDEDAGAGLDAGVLAIECQELTPVPFIGEDSADGNYANAIAMPTDLRASRVVATWARDCNPSALVIEMSDGRCPRGDGHALTFTIAAAEIEANTVGTGINTIVADADGASIRIRYERPEGLEPAGTWGTCPGVAGTLSVRGEITTHRLDDIQALFELELAGCDDSADQAPQSILGTFNVKLRRSASDVCPTE